MIEAHRLISSKCFTGSGKVTAFVKGIVAEGSFAKTVPVVKIISYLLSLLRRAILIMSFHGCYMGYARQSVHIGCFFFYRNTYFEEIFK